MHLTFADTAQVTQNAVEKHQKKLAAYREEVRDLIEAGECTSPEAALATWQDEEMLAAVYALAPQFKRVKHVILVGIGGQTLGVEAIHSVLYDGRRELHVLDTVAPHELFAVLKKLKKIKKVEQVAVVVSSKSGGTIETLTNASTLLAALEEQFGKAIYQQTVTIGNAKNDLLTYGKKVGAHVLPMHEMVGGRYSIFTSAGLLPLLLLGHDIEAILEGVKDAGGDMFEAAAAESAARLHLYLTKGVRTVNFFAFDTRLVKLAKWYRQLAAESLGKATRMDGTANKHGFIPTISTPVELHSVGQLYFSGFAGVYTDFVSLEREEDDVVVSKRSKLAPHLRGNSLLEIGTAIYGGVVGAYNEKQLPYRATVLEDDLAYSLGLFMGMRMLETMYVAHLMQVNAFDQPNVELYKEKTREILETHS